MWLHSLIWEALLKSWPHGKEASLVKNQGRLPTCLNGVCYVRIIEKKNRVVGSWLGMVSGIRETVRGQIL